MVSTKLQPVVGYQLTIQAANSQGIQTLLEAEKEAAKVVQKARQCEYPIGVRFGDQQRCVV